MWIMNALITWTFPSMMENLGGGLTYNLWSVESGDCRGAVESDAGNRWPFFGAD